MKRKSLIIFIVTSLILLSSIYGCGALATTPSPTEQESREVARNFLINAPTYKFDGMPETLKLVSSRKLDFASWEFVFEFDCRQPGYGDRTGLMLAQVITPHTARIEVQKGAVASAVMDGKWDMMKQISIEGGG